MKSANEFTNSSLVTIVIFAKTQFQLLIRDRIFVPLALVSLLVVLFSRVLMTWGITEYRRVLLDTAAFSFHVVGALTAIFWASKPLAGTQSTGLEVYLAGPLSRATWLTGRFLGLIWALCLFSLIFMSILQVTMLAFNFGWLQGHELVSFFLLMWIWFCLAALGTFLAVCMSGALAMFCNLFLWLFGLALEPLSQMLNHRQNPVLKPLGEGFASLWNLQTFNISDLMTQPERFIEFQEILIRMGYGTSLVVLLIFASCLLFSSSDLQ